MARAPYAYTFRDLLVYKKARQVSREIFILSKRFPREEMYALTDQIRRSSRSVGAQIVEAWAKRKYERHFTSKLTDADAEQLETQHWLEEACSCEYITEDDCHRLLALLDEVGRMLYSMMTHADRFCTGEHVREAEAIYACNSDVEPD